MQNKPENKISILAYIEQVRTLYASMPAALLANMITSILLVSIQWGAIDSTVLMLWLNFSIVIVMARFLLLMIYKRMPDVDNNISLWGMLFNLGSSASGLMLGIAGVALFPQADPLHQLTCAFVLVGMSAGAVSTLSVGRYTFPLYISLALLPLLASLLLEGTKFTYILAPMILLAYAFIFKSSRVLYNNNAQNVELRIEATKREQQLLNSQQKQILHLTNTPLAVIEWTADFMVMEWNPAAERIFGYSREQAVGRYGPDLIVPEEVKSGINEIWKSLLSHEGGLESINENIKRDGSVITCEWHNTPLINAAGEVIGVASTARDISERLRAETEVLEARNMLQAVINTIPVRVFWKDKQKKYLGCNAMFAGDANLSSAEEIIGKDDFSMPWKEQGQAYQRDDEDVMKNDRSRIAYEELQTQSDGTKLWIETSKIPLKNANGVIYGVLGTYHDITERKQVESRILASKVEAERANNAKSEFLSRMSHELRTPMNAILGFGQLLEMATDNLTVDQKESVNHILSAGHHLLSLINEVLEISKIDAGEMTLNIEELSLQNLISETLTLMRPMTLDKKILIECSCSSDVLLKTDRKRLKQVLINIISNSVKYNKLNGKVFIHAELIGGDNIVIKVRDTGVGIKPEDQLKIFEPFNRIDDSSHGIEGTGIGLTVTVKLLALMKSTIRCESEYGNGTMFEILMPVDISI